MRHYRQIKNNWCSFYAVANWLMLDLSLTYKTVNVSPYSLIKEFFKKKGWTNLLRTRAWSYLDIMTTLGEIQAELNGVEKNIRILGLIPATLADTRTKPVLGIIDSHAVVIVNEFNGVATIINSQSRRQFTSAPARVLRPEFYTINYML